MDEIILIGAGGHNHSCIDVIEASNQFRIAGMIEKNNLEISCRPKYPVLGSDDDLPDLRNKYEFALITIGQIKSAELRVRLFNKLLELNYKLPVVISPTAYVSESSNIEEGTIIMHDVIVNANAKIGKNCIINNKALIEHDVIIGDHCHISTGAIINGDVKVGNQSFIGSGVITRQSISFGNNCIIGAGEIIKTDVKSNRLIK